MQHGDANFVFAIRSDGDISCLGQALADRRRGERDELMAYAAAYSGLSLPTRTNRLFTPARRLARVVTGERDARREG